MNIEEFQHWLKQAGEDRRVQAAYLLCKKIVQLNSNQGQYHQVSAALSRLTMDKSTRVRQVLAQELSEAANAPRSVILALANDEPDVSDIIYAHSSLLSEADLIEVVNSCDDRLMNIIANRRPISERLTEAIASVASETTARVLLQNPRAAFNKLGLVLLSQKFAHSQELVDLLRKKRELPLFSRLNIFVRNFEESIEPLLYKSTIPLGKLAFRKEVREHATVLFGRKLSRHSQQAIAAELHDNNMISLALMLRAICYDEMDFFLYLFAQVTEFPEERIAEMIQERRWVSFQALFRRLELSSSTIKMFKLAIKHSFITAFPKQRLDSFELKPFVQRRVERLIGDISSSNMKDIEHFVPLLNRILVVFEMQMMTQNQNNIAA